MIRFLHMRNVRLCSNEEESRKDMRRDGYESSSQEYGM